MNGALEVLRVGGVGCPSELLLDRLSAGELAQAQAEVVRAHAAGCAECAARVRERSEGFDALDVDARRLLAAVRRGLDAPSGGWLTGWVTRARAGIAALAAVVGAAAGVAILARPAWRLGTRQKGGLSLRVFRERGGKLEAAPSGDRFAPGDRVRFLVDLPSAGFVRIVGVEESGDLYTAWPLDPAAPTRFEPGERIPLLGAVRLDTSVGHEAFYLVHCPPQVGEPACARGSGPGARPICPPSCGVTAFPFEKGR